MLAKLTESVRAGETDYLNAVFDETLRIRPTVSLAVRSVQKQPYELGGYRLPVETRIGCNPALTHFDPNLFENPLEYRPERFLEERPSNYAYIPFGGGVRRCIGAAFARMEFNVVMERMLDRFDLEPTTEKFEPWGFRSITFAPGNGGLATFTPRRSRIRGRPRRFRCSSSRVIGLPARSVAVADGVQRMSIGRRARRDCAAGLSAERDDDRVPAHRPSSR